MEKVQENRRKDRRLSWFFKASTLQVYPRLAPGKCFLEIKISTNLFALQWERDFISWKLENFTRKRVKGLYLLSEIFCFLPTLEGWRRWTRYQILVSVSLAVVQPALSYIHNSFFLFLIFLIQKYLIIGIINTMQIIHLFLIEIVIGTYRALVVKIWWFKSHHNTVQKDESEHNPIKPFVSVQRVHQFAKPEIHPWIIKNSGWA